MAVTKQKVGGGGGDDGGSKLNNNNKKNYDEFKKERKKHQLTCDGDSGLGIQQMLLSSDYILRKVFRKDGPSLGVAFDSLPSHAFRHCKKGSRKSHRACQENQRAVKRRKVSEHTILDYQVCSALGVPTKKHGIGKGLMNGPGKKHGIGKGLMNGPGKKHGIGQGLLNGPGKKHGIGKGLVNGPGKKHGIGKGLMTVWRVTNPDTGDFPTGVDFGERSLFVMPSATKPTVQEKKKRVQQRKPVSRRLVNKSQEKRKPSIRSRKGKGECQKIEKPKQPCNGKCELALEGVRCQKELDHFEMLIDDEELELRELQAGPNPLTCSAHFATDGLHGCSLCKDLLAKFPPNSVVMRQPLGMQPWDSSPELVKKLIKVFHFLYTYAVKIDICPFTLDEFAQAFHDKDSLLLGKVHVALLKLLLYDVEMELSREFFPRVSRNCRFLGLIHLVEHQEFVLKVWQKSLNPLTWTEILRQVLVAAGFGSKHGALPRESLNKEVNLMAKYGLSPATLKGELFSILLMQGNNGLDVSELAKSSSIVELNLAATTYELELLISSTLSSDITLFEKIASSAFRLRINTVTKETENVQSDSEDFGSVDDDSKDGGECCNADDSEYDSGTSGPSNLERRNHRQSRNNILTVHTEIDESHPGEAWLLGLMESEYSDLSIEEKLNALVALLGVLHAGSSIRMEEPMTYTAESVPNISHYGSGAKIKKSTAKQPGPFGVYVGQTLGNKELDTASVLHTVDSVASISKICEKEESSSKRKDAKQIEVDCDLHPMQSIFLGSDRRYNKYWLFLGPCNANDPGHKRIYFESSEDGHWEVIDTEEAMCTLLSALDRRGAREAFLLASLEKRGAVLCRAMSIRLNDSETRLLTQSDLNMSKEDSSSAVSDVDNNLCLTEIQHDIPLSSAAIVSEAAKKGEQQKQKWSRLQAFDVWIWNSFYCDLNAIKRSRRSYRDSLTRCGHCHDLYWRDEKHCRICHTTFELDFDLEERYAIHVATCRETTDSDKFPKHKVLSSQLQSLKAAIYAIESAVPEDALANGWMKYAHNLWVKRLRRTSTLVEFLQVLADFVNAINENWLYQCNISLGSNSLLEEVIASFPTMPQTSSAVALWLVKLDGLIAPYLEMVDSQKKQALAPRFEGKHAPSR